MLDRQELNQTRLKEKILHPLLSPVFSLIGIDTKEVGTAVVAAAECRLWAGERGVEDGNNEPGFSNLCDKLLFSTAL
jgi:hypothetical protein